MRWIAVDPGEDTGWSLWEDDKLLHAETTKMWDFGDAVARGVLFPHDLIPGMAEDDLPRRFEGIERIVCEDFRIYPKEARMGTLDWDQVRTARLIGALTQTARLGGLEFKLQPALIKERAEAAGATELFDRPLHENRHQNDSIRHAVFYLAVEKGAQDIVGRGKVRTDAS